VIVTGVDAATPNVVTVKVALAVLAGTVTLEGTVAALGVPLASETTAPPGGAYPVRVTVPVEPLPLTTLVGLTATEEFDAGVTVTVPVFWMLE
jgi:hypothetical protein